ncbi:MAG: SMC-Scp complex subunit ScpB [Candidatus Altiarchaeota archaeon]|nr:SMC-Scp complex subunit ScpB [Candidatus Altiarchaeota archaeon]
MRKETLASMLNTDYLMVESALKNLKEKYQGPIVLHETEDTAFMIVEDTYVGSLWFLGKGELSSAELKTLAVVAYHAPVRQSDIVRTRGNRSYSHLKKLEEAGLLNSQASGNTRVFKLSRKFFEYFGDKIVERIRSAPTSKVDKP